MQKQFRRPIETPVGFVVGRDALFLNGAQSDFTQRLLSLELNINGHLASHSPSPTRDYLFFVEFFGVLAYRVIELDSTYDLENQSLDEDKSEGSSFDEIVNSHWILELGGKITKENKHYQVSTYDDVFDVICESFEMRVYDRLVL
jgi:hypothetical protein